MKLAGDQNRSRQSWASNRNGRMRVRRRTQFRTRGEGEREGGREGIKFYSNHFRGREKEKSLVVKYSIHSILVVQGRVGGVSEIAYL